MLLAACQILDFAAYHRECGRSLPVRTQLTKYLTKYVKCLGQLACSAQLACGREMTVSQLISSSLPPPSFSSLLRSPQCQEKLCSFPFHYNYYTIIYAQSQVIISRNLTQNCLNLNTSRAILKRGSVYVKVALKFGPARFLT